MSFSSGAQRDLFYKAEVNYGIVDPTAGGSAPAGFSELRNTEDSISLVRDNFVSDERRGDRGIHEIRLGNKQPAGDIGFELSWGAFDDFLEVALGGTWGGNILKKGNTLGSFSVVKSFSDISQYQLFTGGLINTLSIDINSNAMVTGSFGMLFKDMSSSSGDYVTDTPAIVGTAHPFDGFSGTITEGGGGIAVVSSFSMSLDNGFDRNFVLMASTNPQVTSGKSNVTGSVTLYFEDTTEYTKFVNETESSLTITLSDLDSNTLAINLPRIKYTSAETPVNSDGAVIITMNFQALDDSSAASNIVITRSA